MLAPQWQLALPWSLCSSLWPQRGLRKKQAELGIGKRNALGARR